MRARALPRSLLLIVALAAFLRFAVFAFAAGSSGRFWSEDDADYLALADHLGAGYGSGPGRLFDLGLRRTPVYPVLLRAVFDVFGRHYAAVIAVQLLLSLVTIVLTFWLGRRVLGERVALLAALLLAVDPASIVFGNQMLTETLFGLLLVLTVLLLSIAWERGWWLPALASGVALGTAVLTRPVATYLPAFIIVVLLIARRLPLTRRLVLSAVFVGGFAIPVGGWVIRNAVETGVPIVSTIEGANMLDYRAAGALTEEGATAAAARAQVRRRFAREVSPSANAADRSRTELSVGLAILAEHPVGAFKSWLRGEGRLLAGPAKAETARLLTGDKGASRGWLRLLVLLNEAITLIIVIGGIVGIAVLVVRRINSAGLWMAAVVVAYLVIVSGGPEAYSRFRVPVVPFLAFLTAGLVADLRGRRTARQPPP
jgi:hypothetical protein